MWSLVTETKKGLDNRTEATPLTIDAQYTAGFSWARQYGFRVTKNWNNKAWLGFSIENAQELLTAAGNPTNFLIGGPGTSGGLYNLNANYSANVSPDYILKFAFEPGIGHYEVFGIASDFRDRIYPNATAAKPSAVGAFNDSIWAGGFGANGRWLFAQKHLEAGVHYLGGKGVGRYGDSTLPDLTVDPAGHLKALQSYQVLASLEWHSPKWDVYGYGGGEYVGKTWYGTKPGGSVASRLRIAVCLTTSVAALRRFLDPATALFPVLWETAPAKPRALSKAVPDSGTSPTTAPRVDCRWACSTRTWSVQRGSATAACLRRLLPPTPVPLRLLRRRSRTCGLRLSGITCHKKLAVRFSIRGWSGKPAALFCFSLPLLIPSEARVCSNTLRTVIMVVGAPTQMLMRFLVSLTKGIMMAIGITLPTPEQEKAVALVWVVAFFVMIAIIFGAGWAVLNSISHSMN